MMLKLLRVNYTPQPRYEGDDGGGGDDSNNNDNNHDNNNDNNNHDDNNNHNQDNVFINTVPEEYRADPNVSKHKDVGSLVKSHLELNKLLGAKFGMKDGKFDADDEAKAKIKEHLGLGAPKDIGDYTFDKEGLTKLLPEGTPIRDDVIEGFKKVAQEHDISNEGFSAMMDFYYAKAAEGLKTNAEAMANAEKEVESNLRQEWGNSYTERVVMSERIVDKLNLSDEEKSELKETMKSDVTVRKALASIGSKISEDSIGRGGHGLVMSKDQAQQVVDDLWASKGKILTDKSHPEYAETNKQLQEAEAVLYDGMQSERRVY